MKLCNACKSKELNTHTMNVSDPWFSFLVSGKKKVEGRKASEKWKTLKAGHYIRFFNARGYGGACFLIVDIREYDTLQEYLIQEGLRNVLPGVETVEEGIHIYKQWSTEEELETYPFLAIEVEVE